jgi:hypothetical protein
VAEAVMSEYGGAHFPWSELFGSLGTLELFMTGISVLLIIGIIMVNIRGD